MFGNGAANAELRSVGAYEHYFVLVNKILEIVAVNSLS